MLISETYRAEQARMHATQAYGVMGGKYAPTVARLLDQLRPDDMLDYGAGSRQSLRVGLEALGAWMPPYRAYDPAIEAISAPAEPSRFVCCIDVLEHIEPGLLDSVLDDLKRVTAGVGFYTVHTGPANKRLSDGRNAHLIQQPPDWWLPKIVERWDLQSFQNRPDGFEVIVTAK